MKKNDEQDSQLNKKLGLAALLLTIVFFSALPFAEAATNSSSPPSDFKVLTVRNKSELRNHLKTLASFKVGQSDWEWHSWQLALAAAALDESELSLRLLQRLEQTKKLQLISLDSIHLSTGRVLYQRGELAKSLAAYQKIPRVSDHWIEATEEKAWIHIRSHREDQAIKELLTLLSPLIEPHVGIDPYFALSLANLQICSYSELFRTGRRVQAKVSPRIDSLENLSKAKLFAHEAAKKALDLLMTKPLTMQSISALHPLLPKNFFRDEFFARHIAAAQKANTLDAKTKHQSKAFYRLQQLASQELKETSQTIQKLHLVEAEAIQRMYLDENLSGEGVRPSRTKKVADMNSNQIEFPYSKEVWLDEIDNYRVEVQDCPRINLAAKNK